MPLAPPSLPPYIFLMSDHTTAQLAHDVAEELSRRHPSVFIDDFLAPIHEAFAAMFELDWKRDAGDPRNVGPTERDNIVSLEKWFIEQFGEHRLGNMGRERCIARNMMVDYITVFRDATNAHLIGFRTNTGDCKRVELNPIDTVENIIANLEG